MHNLTTAGIHVEPWKLQGRPGFLFTWLRYIQIGWGKLFWESFWYFSSGWDITINWMNFLGWNSNFSQTAVTQQVTSYILSNGKNILNLIRIKHFSFEWSPVSKQSQDCWIFLPDNCPGTSSLYTLLSWSTVGLVDSNVLIKLLLCRCGVVWWTHPAPSFSNEAVTTACQYTVWRESVSFCGTTQYLLMRMRPQLANTIYVQNVLKTSVSMEKHCITL